MPLTTTPAQVAELVDALASGASIGNDVEVRVLSWAPFIPHIDAHNSLKTLMFWAISGISLTIAEHATPPENTRGGAAQPQSAHGAGHR